jgi:hypothetical protein
MKHLVPTILALPAAVLFGSCTAIKQGLENTTERGYDIASNAGITETPLARLMPAGGLKVVQARQEDLMEMQSGMDRAIAHRKQKRNLFSFFNGPVDFQEPPLPEPGSELDGSLLPPRMPIE